MYTPPQAVMWISMIHASHLWWSLHWLIPLVEKSVTWSSVFRFSKHISSMLMQLFLEQDNKPLCTSFIMMIGLEINSSHNFFFFLFFQLFTRNPVVATYNEHLLGLLRALVKQQSYYQMYFHFEEMPNPYFSEQVIQTAIISHCPIFNIDTWSSHQMQLLTLQSN